MVVRPDDSVERVRLDGDARGVLDVENVPGVGVIAADEKGRVFLWNGTRFAWFDDAEIGFGVEAFVTLDGGFIAAGNVGAMRQRRANGAFCEPIAPLVSQTLRWWSPIPGGFLVSGPYPGIGAQGPTPLSRILYD